jgi:hypothetical protein
LSAVKCVTSASICVLRTQAYRAEIALMCDGTHFITRINRIMNLKLRRLSLWAAVLLVSCLILAAVAPSFADDRHGESRQYSEGGYYGDPAHRDEGGAKASGEIAGWFFGIANFPVVLSILLKILAKALPPGSNLKETIVKINQRQKKYLMNLHYWLNPLAAGAAIFHFILAKCESTFVPELGLIVMLLIFILGLMITFKLSPASMRKTIFKFHTSPISLAVVLFILVIGHSMVD